jgi:hypothetical protein
MLYVLVCGPCHADLSLQDAVAPIVAWTLTPEGGLDDKALEAACSSIPTVQPTADTNMIWYANDALKDDWYKVCVSISS